MNPRGVGNRRGTDYPLPRFHDIRRERIQAIMEICDLRRCHAGVGEASLRTYADCFDHWHDFYSAKSLVRFDDPYGHSRQIESEDRLIEEGFRIVHLPLEMSLHVRGECQPRLIAPPGSAANISLMADALVRAGFETPFTRQWIDEVRVAVDACLPNLSWRSRK